MSKLLDSLNDDELDFTVTITDTDGNTGSYEFLDIVNYRKAEYAVLLPLDGSEDGMVDIFKIIADGSDDEGYEAVSDENVLEKVFEIFKIKNEDEFDFS